jgi:hypothetical protein
MERRAVNFVVFTNHCLGTCENAAENGGSAACFWRRFFRKVLRHRGGSSLVGNARQRDLNDVQTRRPGAI